MSDVVVSSTSPMPRARAAAAFSRALVLLAVAAGLWAFVRFERGEDWQEPAAVGVLLGVLGLGWAWFVAANSRGRARFVFESGRLFVRMGAESVPLAFESVELLRLQFEMDEGPPGVEWSVVARHPRCGLLRLATMQGDDGTPLARAWEPVLNARSSSSSPGGEALPEPSVWRAVEELPGNAFRMACGPGWAGAAIVAAVLCPVPAAALVVVGPSPLSLLVCTGSVLAVGAYPLLRSFARVTVKASPEGVRCRREFGPLPLGPWSRPHPELRLDLAALPDVTWNAGGHPRVWASAPLVLFRRDGRAPSLEELLRLTARLRESAGAR